ncbi:MAG: pseudouridine synthase [Acidimicrobiales bacterium]
MTSPDHRPGSSGEPLGRKDGDPGSLRLQKVLAAAGVGSRRACDELIGDGRVTVDGVVADLGARVDPESARVEVDGIRIPTRAGLVHYLLHKPAGVVTTAADPHGRPTVLDLVPASPRVFPVGRLDLDSEGLLLVTNDGDLAQRLTHPSFGVDKEYLVEVTSSPSAAQLRRLRRGVDIGDGPTAPARVTTIAPRGMRIIIHEGRNRQIRRMCAAVGLEVLRLVRTRIGPLSDTRLAPGQWRPLRDSELSDLEANVARVDQALGSRFDPGARSLPRPRESPAGGDHREPRHRGGDSRGGRGTHAGDSQP